MTQEVHDLVDFMRIATQSMASEYARIRKRAREDPGNAGDQGEENWAALLREWLPRSYHIVTRGRILNEKGIASPQVDVLVLYPSYPPHLLDTKIYLAAGVAAAFECKITLKRQHIVDAARNSAEIARLVPKEEGTPYRELRSSIIYGLLAHSHAFRRDAGQARDKITRQLVDATQMVAEHPREMLQLLCVSNLATWSTYSMPWIALDAEKSDEGYAYTAAMCQDRQSLETYPPIGVMLSSLLQKMAWRDELLAITKCDQFRSRIVTR